MGLSCVTPNNGKVIDDGIAVLHCTVDSNDDIALVQLYRDAAEDNIAKYLKRALLTSVWDYTFDDFPCERSPYGYDHIRKGEIVPPLMPFTAVSSLKYIDSDGTEQTISSSNYIVDTACKPGRVVPAANYSWPTVQVDRKNAVTLRFSAGYSSADVVPASIKAAILLRLGTLYANREDIVTGTIVSPLGRVIEQLLSPYVNRWST